jgi:hypothetical protein
MRTIEEIKVKLQELKSDDRLKSPCATVFENAPLALIQLELEMKILTLEWVLKEV